MKLNHAKRRVAKVLPLVLATTLVSGCLVLCGCQVQSQQKSDDLYQVALLQSLTLGDYDGVITVKELKEKGDIGLGTFDGVNGEMVVLDGTVYQCLGDGSVVKASDDTTVPFSNVTFFDKEITQDLSITDLNDLKSQLNTIVAANGENQFYLLRYDATFDTIQVRSELAQQKPYETFDKVLARDQREFTYQNVKGTIVALYCPSYASGINTPGWHFHFISDDRTQGGHVLAVGTATGSASLDKMSKIDIKLPDTDEFNGLDLGQDQSSRITSVEQKSN